MSDNIFDQNDREQLPDSKPEPNSVRSDVRGELLGAGYSVKESRRCKRCGRELVVYESPEGEEREFNADTDPISPRGLHQLTCRDTTPEVKLPPVPDQQAYIDAIRGQGNGGKQK